MACVSYLTTRPTCRSRPSGPNAPPCVTETGYLWHFTTPTVAALGGPVALVLGWLDEESQTADWKKRDQEARQRGNFFSHRM